MRMCNSYKILQATQKLTQAAISSKKMNVNVVKAVCLILVQRIAYCATVCSGGGNGNDVRLSGFNSSIVGFVDVCKEGKWVPVLLGEPEEWTQKNAFVACRELGFNGAVRIFSQVPSGASFTSMGSSPKHLYNSPQCTGLEQSLVHCQWSLKEAALMKQRQAMVLCKTGPSDGELNIVGVGGSDSEGFLTVYQSWKNQWSSICSTLWDDLDALVACKQLGYNGGYSKTFSISSLEDMSPSNSMYYECEGSEERLSDCRTRPSACSSLQHAGIVCTTEAKDGGSDDSNLTVVILVSLISATLLLIVGLLIMLKCVIKRFKKKQVVQRSRTTVHRRLSRSRQPRIIRTELDPEIPYAINAPPSYHDTILADMRVQSSTVDSPTGEEATSLLVGNVLDSPAGEEETSLLAQDILDATTLTTSSENPQPV